MIKMIIISVFSFVFGFLIREILDRIKVKKRFQKVKPLSKMNKRERKKHMRNLEIK